MSNKCGIIWTDLTLEQAQQIDAFAKQVKQGQAKIDAYNRLHLVARRWLIMKLIRLLS